jgi:hypothetical protein
MPHPSPFAALETSFRLLSRPPHPITVDGRQVGHGAPARPIPIDELPAIALHPAATHDLQSAILNVVIAGLRQDPATWAVVLGGILLPSMRCLAERLDADSAVGSSLRLEAELLWRLAAATRRPPADTHRFAMCLLTCAWRRDAAGRLDPSPLGPHAL